MPGRHVTPMLLGTLLTAQACAHAQAAPPATAPKPTSAETTTPVGNGGLKPIEEVLRDAQEGVKFIGATELDRRIAANARLVLLDVRTAKEYDAGHLKGSAWIERGVAEFVLVRTLPDPDAEIVVYCKAGNRTGLTVKALQRAGYHNVTGLDGGFDAWAQEGRTIYNHLGSFKLVKLADRNAGSLVVDFYADKHEP